jgi:hypothetical protein
MTARAGDLRNRDAGDNKDDLLLRETVTGWGGLGYWGAGYAGNWVDLHARVETDKVGQFAIIS